MGDPETALVGSDTTTRTFSTSMVISGVRCMLAYVVFPWLLPVLGVTGGVGPGVGLVIGTVAIGFNVWSILRFWRTDHRLKWTVIPINLAVIVLLLILVGFDITHLAG
ncbi:MAG: hypothetical protein VX833_03615 [Actinomycetota bacterium]|nr:hypothetical protein [Actinomycetota bacterium]